MRRDRDPADARAVRLAVTDAGRERALAAIADVEEADRAFFAPAAGVAKLALLRALARRDADGAPLA